MVGSWTVKKTKFKTTNTRNDLNEWMVTLKDWTNNENIWDKLEVASAKTKWERIILKFGYVHSGSINVTVKNNWLFSDYKYLMGEIG